MIADNEELHHLYVNIDAGELPGISYTKDLTVTFVQRSGALEDRINVGDKILAVNDCSVSDRNAFDRIQRKQHITRITVNRDKKRGEKIKQEQYVDDKRIIKREGFLYLKVKMTQHRIGTRVGLLSRGLVAQWTTRRSTEPKIVGSTPAEQVKSNKEGHVYVTRVLNGSLSAECLIVGDRILQVNGTIINDKEMAKKIIVQGLLKGNISILVERPDSSKARNFISEVLSVRTPPNTEICH
ncbi:PDZ domain containing protein [Brugia malayi]|uniref:Bm8868 n=1 Tax=Brugia malayi TaxID=6279 RepID=A0A0H5S2P8_BRUMA|nr:PDZ domain containing protein [Brugia malayi]CRZ22917.1 Bm8868 [Brugia malayi]VIO90037.1 PDZ domain containing protein [Brugia malayi]